jgi:plastocyanin
VKLVGLALGASLVLASPAYGAEVVVHATDAPSWDRQLVDIQPGDSVTWSFDGTTQAHNVQSGAGDWGSQVAVAGPAYTRQFTEAGTYHFVCQVHPDTMFGDVRVAEIPPPPPPPPPLSAQPFTNDFTAPVPEETTVSVDRSAPRLSSVSASRKRVRFKVSEDAKVTVAVKHGGRRMKSLSTSGSGRRSVRLPNLRPGHYVIALRATDIAGNRSKTKQLRLTIR